MKWLYLSPKDDHNMEAHSKIRNCTIYRYLHANIHLPNFLESRWMFTAKIMTWSIVTYPRPSALLHPADFKHGSPVEAECFSLFGWRYMWGRHNNIGFHIVQPACFISKSGHSPGAALSPSWACLACILDLPAHLDEWSQSAVGNECPKKLWFKLCTSFSDAEVIVSLIGDMICLASVISMSNSFYRIMVECWKCAV